MEIFEHTQRSESTVQHGHESSLMQIEQQPDRTALVNGKEYLFFSGYAYLAMHSSKAFREAVKKGVDTYGWSFPSSRVSNTRLFLFEEFEHKLSAVTGFKYTAAAANGYTAGRMAMQLFAHKADLFIAPDAHPAVSEGYPKFKGSYKAWSEYVASVLNNHDNMRQPVIVTDSVQPLRGEIKDLSFLQYIEKKIVCIVDDSHGVGMIGENGEGIASYLPKNPNIDYILTYSLSKAFNLNGGAISVNNSKFAEQLRLMPAYAGGTAMAPALMYAFLECQNVYNEQRTKLQHNIQFFASLTANKSTVIHPHAQLPFFIFKQEVSEQQLLDAGIMISSFAYPDPKGKKVQRIVVNAAHTEDDLRQLSEALQ